MAQQAILAAPSPPNPGGNHRDAEHLAAHCFDGVMTADPFTLRRLRSRRTSKKLVFYNFPNLDFFPRQRARPPRNSMLYIAADFPIAREPLCCSKPCASSQITAAQASAFCFSDISTTQQPRQQSASASALWAWNRCVEIRGRIDHEQMADALAQARIGVCPLQPIPKFVLNIPGKGLRILGLRTTGGCKRSASDPPVFRTGHAGLLFRPGNAVELAQSIGWLLDHPDVAARMGANGRASVVAAIQQ